MEDKGWFLVREVEGRTEYISSVSGLLDWTSDFEAALALARRIDADRLSLVVEDCWQIKELRLRGK